MDFQGAGLTCNSLEMRTESTTRPSTSGEAWRAKPEKHPGKTKGKDASCAEKLAKEPM